MAENQELLPLETINVLRAVDHLFSRELIYGIVLSHNLLQAFKIMMPCPSLDEFPIWVLAAYSLHPIEDPKKEACRQKEFLSLRGGRARNYISKEGLNLQMSLPASSAKEYIQWMQEDPRFGEMEFKIQGAKKHPFPRLTVKVRQQLVALDCKVDLQQRSPHLTPAEWKQVLDEDSEVLLLDVRNRYEWEVGRFEGAEAPPCDCFREAKPWAQDLRKRVDPKQKILMCCTGGIRCEFFSALLREEGFEEVFQLEGGMLKYREEVGDAHWKGSLFVFDDRMTIPMGDQENPVGTCLHCQALCSRYLNCANMDCNRLFLCCRECLDRMQGCCSSSCKTADRLRVLNSADPYQPFSRAHLEELVETPPSS